MFSITTHTQRFLADLSNLEQRTDRANRQVSSGLRVQTVSDDPDTVSQIMQLDASIIKNNQVKTNLTQVQTEVNAAEGAINSATLLMDRARQLGAQGSTGTSDSNTRSSLADQIGDVMNEMLGLASTQVNGRYVFSGNNDSVAPWTAIDPTMTNGVGPYQGEVSTRKIEDASGASFSVALTADQLFDSSAAGSSVFGALQSLRTALLSNNQASITTAMTTIASASSYLSNQQAQYGDIQQRVANSLTYQGTIGTNLASQLSAVQDADQAQAIVQLQTDSTAQQAALAAFSSLPKKSLFDYLG